LSLEISRLRRTLCWAVLGSWLVLGAAACSGKHAAAAHDGTGGTAVSQAGASGAGGSRALGQSGAVAGRAAQASIPMTAGQGGRASAGAGASAAGNSASAGKSGNSAAAGSGDGSGAAGTTAGSGGAISYALDCGPSGIVIEGHGPPNNRINYIIVGDGYAQADIDSGLYLAHVNKMLDDPTRKAGAVGRFTEAQQPYLRYRSFVNICAIKTVSVDSGIGTATKNTAFDGYGNDQSRLGYINNTKLNAAIKALVPANIMVDWKGVVMNDAGWWNSGGNPMVWSGGHADAALAAQHEGGHGFQHLADEYGGTDTAPTSEPREIDVTIDAVNTANKWKLWLGFNQVAPGTGMQGVFEGARYCDKGVWRPSQESVMNSLWKSSAFNSISLEQAVRVFYDFVKPIDSSTPTGVTTPQVLNVTVVDPAVLKVDWSVDGAVVAANSGANFDVAAHGLSAGSHQISARAYDDTPWVRGDRSKLEQTVQWTIAVP
jgi:hypothetical protein